MNYELLHRFPIEVERLFDFLRSSRLVEGDFAYIAKEGEVDAPCHVLLVVLHESEQLRIVVAGKRQSAVVFEDKVSHLMHLLRGESAADAAEVEFADESPCDSISVKHGLAAQGEGLEGMAYGVAEIEGFA